MKIIISMPEANKHPQPAPWFMTLPPKPLLSTKFPQIFPSIYERPPHTKIQRPLPPNTPNSKQTFLPPTPTPRTSSTTSQSNQATPTTPTTTDTSSTSAAAPPPPPPKQLPQSLPHQLPDVPHAQNQNQNPVLHDPRKEHLPPNRPEKKPTPITRTPTRTS